MQEGSRGLSVPAKPPEPSPESSASRRDPRRFRAGFWHPSGMRDRFHVRNRGYREYAQPPATFLEPSGFNSRRFPARKERFLGRKSRFLVRKERFPARKALFLVRKEHFL